MDFQIFAGIILAVPFVQLRFGIEQIHLTRPAVLEEANDRFSSGRVMRWSRCKRMKGFEAPRNWRGQAVPREQRRKRQGTESARGEAEKCASVHFKVVTGAVHLEILATLKLNI